MQLIAVMNLYSCAIFLILWTYTAFGSDVTYQPQRQSRDLDPAATVNPQDFYKRAFHSSIVVGQYLYIDGGEVIYKANGTVIDAVENSTYSICLSNSWTNRTVPITRIDKGESYPVLNQPDLWIDASNESFYSYNGEVSWFMQDVYAPTNSIWQFTPSDNSGSWQQASLSAESNFASLGLVRNQQSASTCGGGVCYSLGGFQNWRTTNYGFQYMVQTTPTPGMVSYNTSSGIWANTTESQLTASGSYFEGELVFVPYIGGAGILVPLGGQTSSITTTVDNSYDLDFNSVYMYDIATCTWHNQTVNGDLVPPPRSAFCSVGVQGDNGTFEIFIYGGQGTSDEINIELDTVYVLSLPAFSWQKTSYTPTNPRLEHTCNLAQNRQMVVVGGYNPNVDNQSVTPDVWTMGLGVFDLSDMEWKESYNASAAPYVTPDVVKTWYNENGRYPSQWDDDVVKSWFIAEVATKVNSTSQSGTSSGNRSNGGSPTGAIAGGVVGGIVGLLLIVAIVWCCMRLRSRGSEAAQQKLSLEDQYHKPELENKEVISQYSSTLHRLYPTDFRHPAEMGGTQMFEIYGRPKFEAPGDHGHEMY